MHSGKAKTITVSTTTEGGSYTDIPELAEEGNTFPAVETTPVPLLDGAKTSGSALIPGENRMYEVDNAIVATLITAQQAGTRCWFKYTSFDGLAVAIIGGALGCLMEHAAVQAFTGARSVFVIKYSAGGADEGDVQANTFT